MRLSKLHATGNDFLVTTDEVDKPRAVALCDRHRGVGADGLITLGPGRDGADCTMTLRNADGRTAEITGNGARCLAWAAAREGLGSETELVVDTGAGRRTIELERDGTEVVAATVDMGAVTFEPTDIPFTGTSPFDVEVTYHGATFVGDAAGIGNPHLVLPVDDPAEVKVASFGPRFELDERFPKGVNVEFVGVRGPDELTMRVWERGVGETLSCGTGACAAAAAVHRRGLVGERVAVHVLGGMLTVTLGDTVRLGGPVRHVFDVDVDPEELVAGPERPGPKGQERRV